MKGQRAHKVVYCRMQMLSICTKLKFYLVLGVDLIAGRTCRFCDYMYPKKPANTDSFKWKTRWKPTISVSLAFQPFRR